MENRFNRLEALYDHFEAQTADYRKAAVCEKGCAFCCTDAGSIDITTLEGLRIRNRIQKMPRAQQLSVKKSIAKDARQRENGPSSPCPFLLKNMACRIYDIRPFACRRIYSLERCHGNQSPVIHRQVMALSEKAIRTLQAMDENGYSGHLTFILHMLDTPAFLSTYIAGEFLPEAIMVYGKTHRIVINKFVADIVD